jgi:hypothetical protein
MTDENLKQIIYGLNDNSLAHCVIRAKIISDKIHYYRMLINGNLYDFYLILKNPKKYGSIILEMGGTDLHLYTLEKYRRKGLIKNAMPVIIEQVMKKYKRVCVSSETLFVVNYFIRLGFSLEGKLENTYYLKYTH